MPNDTMPTGAKTWCMRALTEAWTGDADRQNGRFVPTGLLGSIRWWFEVVVRGLGGSACDPSDTQWRCPDRKGPHCVACNLFGCTGWARKFRLQVLDGAGKTQSAPIQKDGTYQLRFVPLRPIRPEEWALIVITLRLIAEYGALGGKTVYKPSDEQSRQNQAHHRDYGMVEASQVPTIVRWTVDQLKAYVSESGWRKLNHGDAAWASLEHFWCVKGRYLARQNTNQSTFNRVIGRPEAKAQAGRNDSWLAGRRAGQGGDPESKKVFSFKSPARTFGFVKPGSLTIDQVKQKLANAWSNFSDAELVAGAQILDDLLKKANQT
jgi:CRISPR-associated protein Cmr1